MLKGECIMSYPLDNLGDYNIIREDLKAVGGAVDILYKNIRNDAISKAKPGILIKAAPFFIAFGSLTTFGIMKIKEIHNNKKLAEIREPVLKEELRKELGRE